MGKIFSYQEIEAGQVPTSEDFELARKTFIEAASECVDIDGSFVYGSVAIGMANKRSDFDSFIALSEDCPRAYSAAKFVVRHVRQETGSNIPMLPIVHPRSALEAGHHDLDRFFGQHLAGSYRLVEGNDPKEYISFPDQPAKDILSDYLFQKKRRLTNTYTSTHPLDVEEGGLQRMLELPPAVGRKTLQALAEVDRYCEAVERSADKAAVLSESHRLFEQHGLARGFDVLVQANKDYDDLLDATLAGSANKNDYEDMLRNLYSRLPGAIIWIGQIAKILVPELAARQDQDRHP